MRKLLVISCLLVLSCEKQEKDFEEKIEKVSTLDIAKYYSNVQELWLELHPKIINRQDQIISKKLDGVHLLKLNRHDEDKDFYVRYAIGAVLGGEEGLIDGYLDVYQDGNNYEARLIVGTHLLSQMDVVMTLESLKVD